ncbi:RDD family protein [Mucilaginibacter sp. PAMB04168]|uniref:RDD family protein n=1 Tax=Mucilaginibacter sp. PAMB04168 TaxID=3138567 RepID=UPI0031F64D4C
MQTVTIHTSQNIDIDYEVASLGDRILARLVDIALFIIIMIMLVIIAIASNYKTLGDVVIGLVIGTYFTLYVFYDLACEIFLNGQSIGKRVMKIKVVSLDGAQPSIGQYLLRWLFRIVDFSLTSDLCALITVAVSDKKQRVGDIVANTTLIKTEPRTQMDQVAFAPVDQGYEPVYKEATQLNDRDIELMHEVINTYMQTGNTTVVYNMAAKVKEHLSVETKPFMDDLQFLQTLIKDYNHIVATSDSNFSA